MRAQGREAARALLPLACLARPVGKQLLLKWEHRTYGKAAGLSSCRLGAVRRCACAGAASAEDLRLCADALGPQPGPGAAAARGAAPPPQPGRQRTVDEAALAAARGDGVCQVGAAGSTAAV